MNEDCTEMELQEILLYSSRHGDTTMVQELLTARQDNKIVLDISCKGMYLSKCINFPIPEEMIQKDFCHIFLYFCETAEIEVCH
jgi:hypothetical protein